MIRAESADKRYLTSFTKGQHGASSDNTPDQGWYEAHGIGKRDLKIKDYLDKP